MIHPSWPRSTASFAVHPERSVLENIQRYLVWFLGQEAGSNPEQIKPGKGLRSYGVDSIASTKLMRGIEKYFQVRVTGRELLAHGTVESLVVHLVGKITRWRDACIPYSLRPVAASRPGQSIWMRR